MFVFTPPEGLDDAFRRLGGLAEDDADALGSFQQLDDHRRAAGDFQQFIGIGCAVGEDRDRQTDALARQQLHAAQLVSGAGKCRPIH